MALFNRHSGLVVVYTTVYGPSGKIIFRLALDTGATHSMLRPAKLHAIGYDFALLQHVPMTTASGIEYVPNVTLQKIEALGQERNDFDILGHTLPPSATVDGVLGLDFLRGQLLTVDFRVGKVELV